MSYKAKKRRLVGPLVVRPMGGWYRVIDQGDGSIIVPTRFKTQAAADRWIERKLSRGSAALEAVGGVAILASGLMVLACIVYCVFLAWLS